MNFQVIARRVEELQFVCVSYFSIRYPFIRAANTLSPLTAFMPLYICSADGVKTHVGVNLKVLVDLN